MDEENELVRVLVRGKVVVDGRRRRSMAAAAMGEERRWCVEVEMVAWRVMWCDEKRGVRVGRGL